jgi:1-acyl-sn-glycerol-3-phosphate acyltransferase
MLSVLLPPSLVGLLAGAVLALSTLTAFLLFVPFIVLKLLVPIAGFRRACTEVLFWIARQWSAFDHVVYRLLYPVAWEIDVRGTLDPNASYLLIGNHQSWIDILLTFDQFHARTPPLCFFLKRELMWVPVIGAACWAMDFPFMSRRSQRADLEATRKFCERFRDQPVTVVNFAEGTRFSEAKRLARGSPYRHLLRPKAAGLAFTLDAMGDQFAGIIDVTIAYRPSKHPILWSFLIGEQTDLAIHIDVLPVPAELMAGNYSEDRAFRDRFHAWLNALWQRKDARLERMINRRPAVAAKPRTT